MTPKELINIQKHLLKLILKCISKFPNVEKIWKWSKYHNIFVFRFSSWQFQKQLMTKPETHLGFKPLKKNQHIKRKISSNKEKSQKDKRVVSPSPSYLQAKCYNSPHICFCFSFAIFILCIENKGDANHDTFEGKLPKLIIN